MEQARTCLEIAHGLKVLEIPEKNSYILVSLLTGAADWSRLSDLQMHYESGPGVLVPVLAFIYMSGGSVKEGELSRINPKYFSPNV